MKKDNEPIVYVVHCVDTEGPQYEPFEEQIDKVNNIFGLDLEKNKENLRKLQRKEIDLNGKEEAVYNVVTPWRLDLNSTWDQITDMLDDITSEDFRQKYPDSFDDGWIYNWFCLDNVGITGENPQRRDLGHHNIFDRYRRYINRNNIQRDMIQWHYHPSSMRPDGPRAGSTYINSPDLYETIARKVIDRMWFPTAYRPGYHTERPDSNWFLEQWIPFDYANQSGATAEDQPDLAGGRFGDWRRAPETWIPYQPSYNDYQSRGNCNRYIARCLNMKNRLRELDETHIHNAFYEAKEHGSALLSFTNHDFRDMRDPIKRVYELIKDIESEFNNVRFKYVDAIEGMRNVLNINDPKIPNFDITLDAVADDSVVQITCENEIFGPQPYLAIKTKNDEYYWENLDFGMDKEWSFTFDFNTICIDSVREIGIAANTPSGGCEVVTIKPESLDKKRNILHIDQ
jgi:hypothetical protein